LFKIQFVQKGERFMPHEATSPEKFGTRIASQIGSVAAAAGERLDAAIDYTKERTDTLKTTVHQLVDDRWSELRDQAVRVPITPLLIGIGAGFCLGWFARSNKTADQ
jgi:hypothetical protein